MDLPDYSPNFWRIYRLLFLEFFYYRYVAATSWKIIEVKLFYFFEKTFHTRIRTHDPRPPMAVPHHYTRDALVNKYF